LVEPTICIAAVVAPNSDIATKLLNQELAKVRKDAAPCSVSSPARELKIIKRTAPVTLEPMVRLPVRVEARSNMQAPREIASGHGPVEIPCMGQERDASDGTKLTTSCTVSVANMEEGDSTMLKVNVKTGAKVSFPPLPPRPNVFPCGSAGVSFQCILGASLLSAGVSTVVAGVGFGSMALVKHRAARDKCGGNLDACPLEHYPDAQALNGAADAYRTAGYWTLGVGGAFTAAGAVLLLLARHAGSADPSANQARSPLEIGFLPATGRGASGVVVQTGW
jgi:hypothetical protein